MANIIINLLEDSNRHRGFVTGFVLFQRAEEAKIESLATDTLFSVSPWFWYGYPMCHPNDAYSSNNSFAQQVSPTLSVSLIICKGKKTDT